MVLHALESLLMAIGTSSPILRPTIVPIRGGHPRFTHRPPRGTERLLSRPIFDEHEQGVRVIAYTEDGITKYQDLTFSSNNRRRADKDRGMGSLDDDQFRRLVHDHSPAIGNYLRRRLYPLASSDLDDLVEETLIVAWKKRADIPRDAELPWMIGVARNVLRNARRSRQRRNALESSLKVQPNDSSAEDYVVADASVREALSKLTDDDREILMLNAWDGLDVHAIGLALSITTNVAAVRLTRAQSRFRRLFASVEVV